jgi:hypothetical protein
METVEVTMDLPIEVYNALKLLSEADKMSIEKAFTDLVQEYLALRRTLAGTLASQVQTRYDHWGSNVYAEWTATYTARNTDTNTWIAKEVLGEAKDG